MRAVGANNMSLTSWIINLEEEDVRSLLGLGLLSIGLEEFNHLINSWEVHVCLLTFRWKKPQRSLKIFGQVIWQVEVK